MELSDLADLPPFIRAIILNGLMAFLMLWRINGPLLKRLAHIEFRVFGDLWWRPFTPNWLTIYSVFMLGGVALFITGSPLWGISIGLFWGLFDRLDGRSAFACGITLSGPDKWRIDDRGMLWMEIYKQDGTLLREEFLKHPSPFRRWWFEMNFPGGTDLGGVLDPGMDKVKTLPILAYFAWLGLVSVPALNVLVAIEAAGTLTRRPFNWFAAHMQGSRASWVGKLKEIAKWFAIIACIPVSQDWIDLESIREAMPPATTGLMDLSILLAFASVALRLKIVRKNAAVTQALDAIGDGGFQHDKE